MLLLLNLGGEVDMVVDDTKAPGAPATVPLLAPLDFLAAIIEAPPADPNPMDMADDDDVLVLGTPLRLVVLLLPILVLVFVRFDLFGRVLFEALMAGRAGTDPLLSNTPLPVDAKEEARLLSLMSLSAWLGIRPRRVRFLAVPSLSESLNLDEASPRLSSNFKRSFFFLLFSYPSNELKP